MSDNRNPAQALNESALSGNQGIQADTVPVTWHKTASGSFNGAPVTYNMPVIKARYRSWSIAQTSQQSEDIKGQ